MLLFDAPHPQMAVTAEIAEEVAAAKATAAAKRRPGGGRRAPAAAAAAAAAGQKSPVVALYDRLKDLFRDHYGVIVGLRGAAQSDDADDDAAETAAVANAWAPIERRLQELALAGASSVWLCGKLASSLVSGRCAVQAALQIRPSCVGHRQTPAKPPPSPLGCSPTSPKPES